MLFFETCHSRYLQPAQKEVSCATLKDDSRDHDERCAREHDLSSIANGIPDGECEAHGAPETSEEQHVLKIPWHFRLSSEIDDPSKWINVDGSADCCAEKSADNEDCIEVMTRKREHRNSDV